MGETERAQVRVTDLSEIPDGYDAAESSIDYVLEDPEGQDPARS